MINPRFSAQGKLLLPETVNLTPFSASLLVFTAVVSGYRYRRNWKTDGPLWKAWLYGTIAGASLLALAFIPLRA